ncbi:MAG TPA: hypothetical protein VJM32_03980 [Candidatus Saccharimonadales bacterium]|nr:hypothetical protein [Candidatus Saccharimonadales bacterium]
MAYKKYIGLAGMVVAGFLVAAVAVPASAHMEGERGHEHTDTTAQSAREAAKARVQGKLDETKRKVCANRTDAIKKIMSRAAEAGQKHLTLFSAVQARVEEFYAKKKLNVANYEALKTTAIAKRDATVSALQAVSDSTVLDCSADNPVGAADAFKAKVKAMHDALKEYRSSVNALLVAVKTAAKATEGGQ